MLSLSLTVTTYGLMLHVGSLRATVEPLDMPFPACGGPAPLVAVGPYGVQLHGVVDVVRSLFLV